MLTFYLVLQNASKTLHGSHTNGHICSLPEMDTDTHTVQYTLKGDTYSSLFNAVCIIHKIYYSYVVRWYVP